VRFISFITLSAGRSQIVSIHDLDVNRTGISSLFQDNRRSSVTPAPIRLRTAKIPCSGTVRVQTEWSGSLVDRLVMEAHQLHGPCRKHGIRSAVVIAELDFLDTRSPILNHSADLAPDDLLQADRRQAQRQNAWQFQT